VSKLLGFNDSEDDTNESESLIFNGYSTKDIHFPKCLVTIDSDEKGEATLSFDTKQTSRYRFYLDGFELVSRPTDEFLSESATAKHSLLLNHRFSEGVPVIYAIGRLYPFNMDTSEITIAIPLKVSLKPEHLKFDNDLIDSGGLVKNVDVDLKNKLESIERRSLSFIPEMIQNVFNDVNKSSFGHLSANNGISSFYKDILLFKAIGESDLLVFIETLLEGYKEGLDSGVFTEGFYSYLKEIETSDSDLRTRDIVWNFLNPKDYFGEIQSTKYFNILDELKSFVNSLDPEDLDEWKKSLTGYSEPGQGMLMVVNDVDRYDDNITRDDIQLYLELLMDHEKNSMNNTLNDLIYLVFSNQYFYLILFQKNNPSLCQSYHINKNAFDQNYINLFFDDSVERLRNYEGHGVENTINKIRKMKKVMDILTNKGFVRHSGHTELAVSYSVKSKSERLTIIKNTINWAFLTFGIIESEKNKEPFWLDKTFDDVLDAFINGWTSSVLNDLPNRHLVKPIHIAIGDNNIIVKVLLNTENQKDFVNIDASTSCRRNLMLELASDDNLNSQTGRRIDEFIELGNEARAVTHEGFVPFVIPHMKAKRYSNNFSIIEGCLKNVLSRWLDVTVGYGIDEYLECMLYHISICIRILRAKSILENKLGSELGSIAWMDNLMVPFFTSYVTSAEVNWYILVTHLVYCLMYMDHLLYELNLEVKRSGTDMLQDIGGGVDLEKLKMMSKTPHEHVPDCIKNGESHRSMGLKIVIDTLHDIEMDIDTPDTHSIKDINYLKEIQTQYDKNDTPIALNERLNNIIKGEFESNTYSTKPPFQGLKARDTIVKTFALLLN